MRRRAHTLVLLIAVSILMSCRKTQDPIPLPRAYPKIDYPEKTYVSFAESYCPLSFERPSYTEIKQDNRFFGEKSEHDCWFDLHIPDFNGDIHCSYKSLRNFEDYEKSISDAFRLSNKHVKRADFIEEVVFTNSHGCSGILFLMDGPTATPAQFFVTDTTNHFFRASLYLNAEVNRDSTKPIYDFLLEDMRQMIESFQWQEEG